MSRPFRPGSRARLRVALAGFLVLSGAVAADDFPEVTAAEKAFQSFPDEPTAPVVTLSRQAELWMMDLARGEASSRLVVRERRKVLSQAGVDRADVRVVHNAFVRLLSFRGRTVLADGRVLPLPKDAQFRSTASRSQRLFVTSVAFPGVEPGAILDYSYEMRWDSIFFLDPFYFQADVPVLSAEITYHVPGNIKATAWSWDPLQLGIQSEVASEMRGFSSLRAWARNLPSVPSEPAAPPFGDMAAQMMLIPVGYYDRDVAQPLMGDWREVCRLFDMQYEFARSRDGSARTKARELTASAKTARAKAETLYRFVRDSIETEPRLGVGLVENATVGETLRKGRGDPADKALLLEVMLRAVKLEPQMVWTADRAGGRVDATVPNPAWFDAPVIRLDLDGKTVYLDPADRALAFGQLAPGLHGTTALRFDRKKPEVLQLPSSGPEENRRSAVLELVVDDEGGVRGSGSLVMTGAHAWLRTRWQPGESETANAWQDWLESNLPDYAITEVSFLEVVDEIPRVEVHWTLALREEKSLPDEATLHPSHPLGPVRASDLFPAAGRSTPVYLPFADRDEVELRVTWPAGWRIEAGPRPVDFDNVAGAVRTAVEIDPAARRAVLTRRVDVKRAMAATREMVVGLDAALREAEKADAQVLLLARE